MLYLIYIVAMALYMGPDVQSDPIWLPTAKTMIATQLHSGFRSMIPITGILILKPPLHVYYEFILEKYFSNDLKSLQLYTKA